MNSRLQTDTGMMRVVRAFSRWEDEEHRVPPFGHTSGFYVPSHDEAMVSIVVPSDIALYLFVSIFLRRNDATEILVGEVPGVVFGEHTMNRIPFHGSVDETSEYEVQFRSRAVYDLFVNAAVLVFQP